MLFAQKPSIRAAGRRTAVILTGVLLAVTSHFPVLAGGTEITIDNFTFTPPALTISVGTTVTWINHDDIPHSVAEKDRLFKSPVLDTNEKFSYTFTKVGTVEYFCGIHPHMTGKITVNP
jgi:plastocyanin